MSYIESIIIRDDNGNQAEVSANGALSVSDATMQSLVATLNELTSRLATLSAAKGVQESIRVTPISSVSTAVTGSVTATVSNATISTIGAGGYGTNAINNTLVTLANINNVTV